MNCRHWVLTSIILFVWLFSCERNKDRVTLVLNPDAPKDIVYTHQDSLEAYELALWMTGELTAPDEWVSRLMYDLYYLHKASLWLDIKILVMTIPFVFNPK